MAKVNWTEESEKNLQEIYEYIARDNPRAAEKVIDGIIRKSELLEQFPEIGFNYELKSRTVKVILFGHYRIVYAVVTLERIDILGVFHTAMDIHRYLS